MPQDIAPRFGLPFLHAGQAQKEVYHNEALALIDVLVHAQALSALLDEPPSAPVLGQCWIVGSSPVGAWNGWPKALACWTLGGWRFIPPRDGMRVYVEDEGLDYLYDENAWKRSAVRPAGFFLSDVQVVGARQAAIPAPSGGGTIDAQARTAILAILNALQNHGLVEGGE